MHILIVCSGNTCRSPLAAALLTEALVASGRSNVTVQSAGTGAWEGAPASEGAYLVGLERGLDLSAHRARLITRALVDEADIVLTMSRPHLARVRELGGGGRAHLFGEYAGLTGHRADIPDPYGGDLDEYRATIRTLADLMPAVVGRIADSARP